MASVLSKRGSSSAAEELHSHLEYIFDVDNDKDNGCVNDAF
ncbi:MAG: hypothetical protein ACJ71R_00310 [Nitrososphaeraceae archaeon]